MSHLRSRTQRRDSRGVEAWPTCGGRGVARPNSVGERGKPQIFSNPSIKRGHYLDTNPPPPSISLESVVDTMKRRKTCGSESATANLSRVPQSYSIAPDPSPARSHGDAASVWLGSRFSDMQAKEIVRRNVCSRPEIFLRSHRIGRTLRGNLVQNSFGTSARFVRAEPTSHKAVMELKPRPGMGNRTTDIGTTTERICPASFTGYKDTRICTDHRGTTPAIGPGSYHRTR